VAELKLLIFYLLPSNYGTKIINFNVSKAISWVFVQALIRLVLKKYIIYYTIELL